VRKRTAVPVELHNPYPETESEQQEDRSED